MHIPIDEVPTKLIDSWEIYQDNHKSKNIRYVVYCLVDPRYNCVCYIGLTKQKFRKRLLQHRNPAKTNKSAIAKLQRHLIKNNLTLQGHELVSGDKDDVGRFEKNTIKYLRNKYGRKSLKNHQDGGFNSYGKCLKSKKKTLTTVQKNKNKYKYRGGENSSSNKILKDQVLQIYLLINNFYSNREIIDILELPIGLTGICAIRKGRVWTKLFKDKNMIFIPSLNTYKGAATSQEKIDILNRIEKGEPINKIRDFYNNKVSLSDLKRIKDKKLWKMAWNVYNNYYKLKINE